MADVPDFDALKQQALVRDSSKGFDAQREMYVLFKNYPKEAGKTLQDCLFGLLDSGGKNWALRAGEILDFFLEKCTPDNFPMDEDRAVAYFEKAVPYSKITALSNIGYLQEKSAINADNEKRFDAGWEKNTEADEALLTLVASYCKFLAAFGGKKSLDRLFEAMLSSTDHTASVSTSSAIMDDGRGILARVGDSARYSRMMEQCLQERYAFAMGPRFDSSVYSNALEDVRITEPISHTLAFAMIFHKVDAGKAPYNENYEQLLIKTLEWMVESNGAQDAMNELDLNVYSAYGGKALCDFFKTQLAAVQSMLVTKEFVLHGEILRNEHPIAQEKMVSNAEEAIPKIKLAIREIGLRMAEREKTATAIKTTVNALRPGADKPQPKESQGRVTKA